MTQQGLSAEEIAVIMSSRGMKLTKGASTISRLQSRWNIKDDEKLRIKNVRYLSRKKARRHQLEEFQRYARELGVDDAEAWVKRKMAEPAVIQMRQDAAHKMMGDAAPEPKSKNPATKISANGNGTTRRSRVKSTRKSTNAGQDKADTDMSSNESEEESFATPATATRTLRSTRRVIPTARNPIVVPDDSDDGSTDCDGDADYEPMATGPEDNAGNGADNGAGNSPDHGYQPMMDYSDDDEDDYDDGGEENEIEESHSTANQRLITNPQQSVRDTTANTHFIQALEELKTMESLISSADNCIAAAQEVKDMLKTRMHGRTAPNSVTGLPLSSGEIEVAKRKLKELAQSILNTF